MIERVSVLRKMGKLIPIRIKASWHLLTASDQQPISSLLPGLTCRLQTLLGVKTMMLHESAVALSYDCFFSSIHVEKGSRLREALPELLKTDTDKPMSSSVLPSPIV